MDSPTDHSELERLALQRKALAEKFGLFPESGERPWRLAETQASQASDSASLERSYSPRKILTSGVVSSEETSSPRTPSVVQIDQEGPETELREAVPDPGRDYGLQLQGDRFTYRALVHEQARAPRELLTVTSVTVYASPFEESTARRIAVHEHWIAYAVKNHIRLLHRRQGHRALLKGHDGVVEDLAIATKCSRLLLSAATDGSIRLWRLHGWDAEPTSPSEQQQWQTQVCSRRSLRVALSPDGGWMAFTEDAKVHVMPLTAQGTVDSSRQVSIPSTHEVRDLVFVANSSPTGWCLVIASAHGMVLIAEPESGTIVGEFSAHGGVPVERVLSVAPNVVVTAAERCSELWYWRLSGHWKPPGSGSVHLLARCSFHELPGFGVLAGDPDGEFLFLANSGAKQLFILHHGSSTHLPDYLVQIPLRHVVLSCCATRTIRRERDLDENSGLPQVRECTELDLWCIHEKSIQAYHGRREDLVCALQPSAVETWSESSEEGRPSTMERSGDTAPFPSGDGAMSTSPPVLLTHTHTLYEAFRRIAPQLSQRRDRTGVASTETVNSQEVSKDSRNPLPVPVTIGARVDASRAPVTPDLMDTTEQKDMFPGTTTHAGSWASLEGRLGQLEQRLSQIESLMHQVLERMSALSTESTSSAQHLMQTMATERLVPALERASAMTADSLSRALDEAIQLRLMPCFQRLEHVLQRAGGWPPQGPAPLELPGAPLHASLPPPSLSPREEILRWLQQSPEPAIDRAFHLALSLSDLETLMWLCEQRLPDEVCEKLSQPVLLSLVQQLAFDLRTQLERKLAYLEEAVPLIQPSDPVIARHVEPTMRQLVEHLDEQVLHASSSLPASLRTRARLLRKIAALLVPTMSAS